MGHTVEVISLLSGFSSFLIRNFESNLDFVLPESRNIYSVKCMALFLGRQDLWKLSKETWASSSSQMPNCSYMSSIWEVAGGLFMSLEGGVRNISKYHFQKFWYVFKFSYIKSNNTLHVCAVPIMNEVNMWKCWLETMIHHASVLKQNEMGWLSLVSPQGLLEWLACPPAEECW